MRLLADTDHGATARTTNIHRRDGSVQPHQRELD